MLWMLLNEVLIWQSSLQRWLYFKPQLGCSSAQDGTFITAVKWPASYPAGKLINLMCEIQSDAFKIEEVTHTLPWSLTETTWLISGGWVIGGLNLYFGPSIQLSSLLSLKSNFWLIYQNCFLLAKSTRKMSKFTEIKTLCASTVISLSESCFYINISIYIILYYIIIWLAQVAGPAYHFIHLLFMIDECTGQNVALAILLQWGCYCSPSFVQETGTGNDF